MDAKSHHLTRALWSGAHDARRAATWVAFALAATSCAGLPDDATDQAPLETVREAIDNGSAEPNNTIGAVAVFNGFTTATGMPRPCSGVRIAGNWILTANHCVRAGQESAPSQIRISALSDPGTLAPSSAVTVSQVVRRGGCPSTGDANALANCVDFALLRTSSPVTSTPYAVSFYGADVSSLPGSALYVAGYGKNVNDSENNNTGAGHLRSAMLTVAPNPFIDGVGNSIFNLNAGSGGQQTDHGDSGGPSYYLDWSAGKLRLAGIHHVVDGDSFVGPVKPWIYQTLLGAADVVGVNFFSNTRPSGFSATSWGVNSVHAVTRDSHNAIAYLQYINGSASWSFLGAPPAGIGSDPAIAAWGPGRLDVVLRGGDGAVWHIYYANGTWSTWGSLGGNVTGGPSISSRGSNVLDIVARASDGNFWRKQFNQDWEVPSNAFGSPWHQIGGAAFNTDGDAFTGAAASVSWGPDRLDVFAKNTAGNLVHGWCPSSCASHTITLNWENLGGAYITAPTATSGTGSRIDVLALSNDNRLHQRVFDQTWWNDFVLVNYGFQGRPGIVASGAGRFDYFALEDGSNPSVQHRVWPK